MNAGSWPMILTILGVGYTLGRVRPLRGVVHALRRCLRALPFERLVESASRLGRRQRI